MSSKTYWKLMADDNRLITIEENGKWSVILTYSICDHYIAYENKGLWEYMNHDPNGSIFYVEKLIAVKWNRAIREALEETVVANYPNVKFGVWYRPGKNGENDRKVIYRVKNETSLRD